MAYYVRDEELKHEQHRQVSLALITPLGEAWCLKCNARVVVSTGRMERCGRFDDANGAPDVSLQRV